MVVSLPRVAYWVFWKADSSPVRIHIRVSERHETDITPLEDMVLFLSYFYTGKELPVRLSLFWVSLTLTNISGALLGYGILRMRYVSLSRV